MKNEDYRCRKLFLSPDFRHQGVQEYVLFIRERLFSILLHTPFLMLNRTVMHILPMSSRLFLMVLFYLCLMPAMSAQSSSCPEADKIEKERKAHNAKYERIKSDLQNGLYCSECKNSKTEIESSGIETFEQHLVSVSGVALPASQKQMDEAHQKYLKEYDRLKRNMESALTTCHEKAQQELERKKREEEAKRKEAERVAEEARKKRETEQREAAQKQKAAAEEAKQKKETQEREAREAEEQRKLEAQQKAEAQLKQLQEQWAREAEIRRQELEALRRDLMGLQQSMAGRPDNNARVLEELEKTLGAYQNKQIGTGPPQGRTAKPGIPDWVSEESLDMLHQAGSIDDDDFQKASSALQAANTANALYEVYNGGWASVEEMGIINFLESLGATSPLQYGQVEGLKFIERIGNIAFEKWYAVVEKNIADNNWGQHIPDEPNPGPIPAWPPPSAQDDNPGYGQVTFWLGEDLLCDNITVDIQGFSSTISKYYSGGAPGCGASGCANFTLPSGTYSYTASCAGKVTEGSITISEGGCCMMQLTN